MNAETKTTETTEVTQTKLEKQLEAVHNFKSRIGANIQINKSGGIFLRHPVFQAWSFKDGGKAYTASVNMNVEVLRALLDNPLLLKEVKEFLKNVPSTMGLTEEEMATFVEQFQKKKKA